jgi:uncharacterized membrane protein (UPF0127 family)
LVVVAGKNYYVEVADTAIEREQGLSNREGLGPDSGMLFDFGIPKEACIWMKDMKFSLDIAWIQDGVVTKVLSNVLPSTYPDTFCPDRPVRHVLELNAGSGIRVGDGVKLKHYECVPSTSFNYRRYRSNCYRATGSFHIPIFVGSRWGYFG